MIGKPTLYDELMAYIAAWPTGDGPGDEPDDEPLKGYQLEGMALRTFGRTATTVSARLRELEQAGFLSKDYKEETRGGRKHNFVRYTCSSEQYAAWRLGRGQHTATGLAQLGLHGFIMQHDLADEIAEAAAEAIIATDPASTGTGGDVGASLCTPFEEPTETAAQPVPADAVRQPTGQADNSSSDVKTGQLDLGDCMGTPPEPGGVVS